MGSREFEGKVMFGSKLIGIGQYAGEDQISSFERKFGISSLGWDFGLMIKILTSHIGVPGFAFWLELPNPPAHMQTLMGRVGSSSHGVLAIHVGDLH